MSNILSRSIVISLSLTEALKALSYDKDISPENDYLDADNQEDVYCEEISEDQVLNGHYSTPENFEKTDIYFPSVCARAYTDATRDSLACEVSAHRRETVRQAIELMNMDIDYDGVDRDGAEVKVKMPLAGVTASEIVMEDATLKITILNPEHFLNNIQEALGCASEELVVDVAMSDDKIREEFISACHDFFNHYDARKPSIFAGRIQGIEWDSCVASAFEFQFDLFAEDLQAISSAILETVERDPELDVKDIVKTAAKVTKLTQKSIKESLRQMIAERQQEKLASDKGLLKQLA